MFSLNGRCLRAPRSSESHDAALFVKKGRTYHDENCWTGLRGG